MKANHKHEYARYVTWARIRRYDGTITSEKYKNSTQAICIDCGHTNRRAYKTAIEIEVSPKEWLTYKTT